MKSLFCHNLKQRWPWLQNRITTVCLWSGQCQICQINFNLVSRKKNFFCFFEAGTKVKAATDYDKSKFSLISGQNINKRQHTNMQLALKPNGSGLKIVGSAWNKLT